MDIHDTSFNTTHFVQPLTRRNKIECKPELVIGKLQKFYQNCTEIDRLMPYLTGSSSISLRIIDWFVTKESRKNFTQYVLNNQKFVVFLSYKGQLRAYSKKFFDPNCRRERIMFEIPGKEPFLTTIGKLNFFKWAYECKVIDFIEENIDKLREGYNSFLKENSIQLKKSTSSLSSHESQQDSVQSLQASGSSNSSKLSQSSTLSAVSVLSMSSNSSNIIENANILLTPISTLNPNRSTRRRRSKQIPSSLQQLQIQNDAKPIVLDFS